MLVSHRHRFIYVKTSKTAGTSIESYFEPLCMGEGEWEQASQRDEYVSPHGIIGYRGGARPPGCRWWNHMPAWLIRERLGEDAWAGYLKFCVVRNPYERTISNFYFFRATGVLSSTPGVSDPLAFEEWLASWDAVQDGDKYLIDGRLAMDACVRYETLEGDLENLCRRLAVPWDPARLPRFKSGMRPRWASVHTLYTPRARALVAAAYAEELALFGYGYPG